MSQTIVPPAPAPGATAGPGDPGATAGRSLRARVDSVAAALRHSLDGTPGRLRVVSAVAVLAAVLIALGGGAALRERSAALDSASAAAAHLVLLQDVQTDLVQADSLATNSFLSFGQEPRDQRVDYLDLIRQASGNLTAAAAAGADDAEALGAANEALTRYTSFVASARAYNSRGLPVGASYLKTASELMQSDILPKITERTAADKAAIDSAFGRAGRAVFYLALVVVLGLGGLIWAQLQLARRSHRYLNLPLLASTAAVVVGLLIAGVVMVSAQSSANAVRAGDLTPAIQLSDSRVAAFTAKSIESLTLINRGSGVTQEPRWAAEMEKAKKLPGGSAGPAQALAGYAEQHAQIRKADDAGSWNDARIQAVDTEAGSANALFRAYASTSDTALAARSADTTAGLADAGRWLFPAGLLLVLLGLGAAVGAWSGVSLRLDEYR